MNDDPPESAVDSEDGVVQTVTITVEDDPFTGLQLTDLSRFLMALDTAVRVSTSSTLNFNAVQTPYVVHGNISIGGAIQSIPIVGGPVGGGPIGGSIGASPIVGPLQAGAFQRDVNAFASGYVPLIGSQLTIVSISYNSPFKLTLKGAIGTLIAAQMLLAGGDIKVSRIGSVNLTFHFQSLPDAIEHVFKKVGGNQDPSQTNP